MNQNILTITEIIMSLCEIDCLGENGNLSQANRILYIDYIRLLVRRKNRTHQIAQAACPTSEIPGKKPIAIFIRRSMPISDAPEFQVV